ncbi:MAG: hypothetical protein P8H94_09100 [Crocinitomicaceae bacterium]|jgi:YVTN family beta-propeller protein|nr:hypothetical protein [Crocinitomicaceae bacterium]
MRLIKFLSCLCLLLYSCGKNNEPPIETESISNGALVLCEGLFQQNNAQLSFVSFNNNQIENNVFLNRNGRQLGDTGNDIKKYGNKIYIVVNVSSTIEVLDANTLSSIKQISMMNGNTAKQPRAIVFHGGLAFVSCFDGYVDVIDTTSLSINSRIQVGSNPDGLAIANNKLYVGNSGGLNSPLMDSTVSVIDLNTLQEIKKITVGMNPGTIQADPFGDIYVVTRGNYTSIPSRMKRLNSVSDSLEQTFDLDISGISSFNNDFLVTYYDFTSSQNNVGLFNTYTEELELDSFMPLEEVQTLYGLHYNPSNNKIYISDAMNYTNTGYLREYDAEGSYLQSFHVGLNPSKVLFYE